MIVIPTVLIALFSCYMEVRIWVCIEQPMSVYLHLRIVDFGRREEGRLWTNRLSIGDCATVRRIQRLFNGLLLTLLKGKCEQINRNTYEAGRGISYTCSSNKHSC